MFIRSGGGLPAYDFLNDPAINIDMTNYDEFVRNNSADQQKDMSVSMGSGREKEANDATAKLWSISRLSLELDDSSHLSLNFSQSSGEIFGTGNMTLGNKTEPVGAFGELFGDGLYLNIVSFSGKTISV